MIKNNKKLLGYLMIGFIGVIFAFLVRLKSSNDYDAALGYYKKDSQIEAEIAAKALGSSFGQLYQGLRTIGLLPGVKKIDRYGKSLDADAHETITQIYNNMVNNVAISEIYIVSADIEPEKIDAVTGGLQEPILMYDGSVVDPNKPESTKPPVTSIEQAMKVDEVEIYEYRLLKEQMSYLKQSYPDQSHVDKLNLPFIGGHEVLTCDNDDYDKTKADADRAGAVLSVPFFGPDGVLKGATSAVIRNNVIKGMMPGMHYALINENYNYIVTSKEAGQEKKSAEWVGKYKADPKLLFSTVVPIATTDPHSQWALWVGYPDSKFLDSGDAKAVRNFSYFGYGLSALLTLMGMAVWAILQRSFSQMKKNNEELERKVGERTKEVEDMSLAQEKQKEEAEKQKRLVMHKMADGFEASVSGVVSGVNSSAVQMNSSATAMSATAEETSKQAAIVSSAATEASANVQTVASSAEELSASITEISRQVIECSAVAKEAVSEAERTGIQMTKLSDTSKSIGDVVNLINEIAAQTNLLALNATIEAARAGDAGRGFAVVASEVKGLATQTAKATEGINRQIVDIQTSATDAVVAIQRISGIIERISRIQAGIAAAVEEQSAATNEIARNVQEAATGTSQVSENIDVVMQAAESTGKSSVQVLTAAKGLAQQSETLRSEVEKFLASVRSA